jgi:rod shape-determining protein MreB and related proteins
MAWILARRGGDVSIRRRWEPGDSEHARRSVRLGKLGRATDVAVDLGTANTVVFRRGEGIVLFEPSVVAIDERSSEVLAVGNEARRMLGRTPATITASRPLRHGVIADFETTEQMLRHFIRRAGGRGAEMIVCVPSGLTNVERSAVVEAALAAGARSANLIEEALAAAIGAGLPVGEPIGSMVVDVGGGTTELAVTALGDVVVSGSLQVGGYDFDEAIVRWLQRERLQVGQDQAEELKIEIGSAIESTDDLSTAEVTGRDALSGRLRRAVVDADQVRAALANPLRQIVDAVRDVLERTPAELSSDIATRGMTVVGGGTLLRGFDELLRRETGLPVIRDDDPLTTVARGAGAALAEIDTLRARERAQRKRRRR